MIGHHDDDLSKERKEKRLHECLDAIVSAVLIQRVLRYWMLPLMKRLDGAIERGLEGEEGGDKKADGQKIVGGADAVIVTQHAEPTQANKVRQGGRRADDCT
jgi:hypothetical protein